MEKTCRRGHQHSDYRCLQCAREQSSRWKREHPVEKRSYDAKWSKSAAGIAKNKRYRIANPELRRAMKGRERAKKFGVEVGGITSSNLQALFRFQDGRCVYCCEELGGDKHIDHCTPFARGGGHTMDNVAWACEPCNRHKHNMTAVEYRLYSAGVEVTIQCKRGHTKPAKGECMECNRERERRYYAEHRVGVAA